MSGSTLFVGNLSWQATEEDLKKAFPTATAVRIVMGDGRPKGYGYAEFASPEEARRAMDQNQHLEIEGRPVRLDFAVCLFFRDSHNLNSLLRRLVSIHPVVLLFNRPSNKTRRRPPFL